MSYAYSVKYLVHRKNAYLINTPGCKNSNGPNGIRKNARPDDRSDGR